MGGMRWLIFLTIGLPLQLVVFLLYPFGALLWWLSIYKRTSTLSWPVIGDYPETPAHSATKDYFLDNTDDHGAFSHIYYWLCYPPHCWQGLHLLQSNGALVRRYANDRREDHRVSGDVVVFWAWAAALMGEYTGGNFKIVNVKKVVDHYIRNLGVKSTLDTGDYAVSTRCNNFGVNYCPDGWGKIGQPMAGPQYYTNAAMLALGARTLGGRYRVYYWLHWLFMGGWYWWFAPILYSKRDKLAYVRDVTMKGLHTVKLCGLETWFDRQAFKFINETIAECKSPLFHAMQGTLSDDVVLPKVLNPWFSQTIDCANGDESTTNSYTPRGLWVINEISKRF